MKYTVLKNYAPLNQSWQELDELSEISSRCGVVYCTSTCTQKMALLIFVRSVQIQTFEYSYDLNSNPDFDPFKRSNTSRHVEKANLFIHRWNFEPYGYATDRCCVTTTSPIWPLESTKADVSDKFNRNHVHNSCWCPWKNQAGSWVSVWGGKLDVKWT